MEISNYVLKLSGKVELKEPLEIAKSYKVIFDGEIREAKDSSNDDGTLTRTYTFAPIIGDILGDNGSVTKTRDARKRSQQLRACIRQEWMSSASSKEENQYYEDRMLGIIQKVINGEV